MSDAPDQAAPALIVGATGMIGQAVVAAWPDDRPLHILARRSLDGAEPGPGIRAHVAPPEDWASRVAAVRPRALLCALGTTIAQAGSREAFRAVDHDLVLNVAKAARDAGCPHMLVVSSVGAMPASSNFYLRTKAEMEGALRSLEFDRLDIFQPGLLMGERGGPVRRGEAIAMRLAPFTDALLPGPLRRYRSVPAQAVARAMIAASAASAPGTFVHHHDAILHLAESAKVRD